MGAVGGVRDLLMYTHRVWVPLLLCSTPGYSSRVLNEGQLSWGHYGCHRATGQPGAEKRGGGGGGEEEARTGNPCARKPGRAVSQVPAVHRRSGRHRRATQVDQGPP